MILSKNLFLLIGIIQFLVGLYGFFNGKNDLLLLNLLINWLVSLVFAYQKKQNTIIYFFFLITFFVFLLGQDVILKIFKYVTLSEINIYEFSDKIQSHVYFCLHLSLFFTSLGVLYKLPKINDIHIGLPIKNRDYLLYLTYRIFRYAVFFKYLSNAILAYNTVIYGYAIIDDDRIQGGYLLAKLAQLADISFVAFLLLAPSKQQLLRPLCLFLGASVLSLLGGARGDLMYELLFIFVYLFFRDYISKRNNRWNEVFISKRLLICLFVTAPFLLIFLNLYASIRQNADVISNGILGDFLGFFIQQGGSYNLIGYTEEYKWSLPNTNISYTFGPLLERIEPFRSNYLQPDPQTYDAYYGNNLGSTITCLVVPNYYYSGGGFGTQYIAEIYADFGYYGIAFFSFILGILLSKAIFFNSRNWIFAVLFATTIPSILSMPRDFYMTFVTKIFSIWNIIFLIIIKYYANKKVNPR